VSKAAAAAAWGRTLNQQPAGWCHAASSSAAVTSVSGRGYNFLQAFPQRILFDPAIIRAKTTEILIQNSIIEEYIEYTYTDG